MESKCNTQEKFKQLREFDAGCGEEFLGEPYGEKAHELLHTYYVKRENM